MKIERRVSLDAIYLDENIEKHLAEHVSNVIIKECSREVGYIISVEKIVEIRNNFISHATSDIMFDIVIEVNTHKPVEGLIVEGVVCRIIADSGIFVDVMDKYKVLLLFSSIPSYKTKGDCIIVGNKRYREGFPISLKLTSVHYDNDNFNCIGILTD